ncbi:MAG: GntG family PLP-dependent aldolase [Planctomycetota bacterium]
MDTPVDLRSDTVTRPTPAMREAMASAALGDDVLEGDPTVGSLEEKVAGLLGKEAALFVPSGTMANLLALRSQTSHGDEMICDHESHIVYYETGGYAAVAGLSVRYTRGKNGLLTADDFEPLVRLWDDPHFPRPRLLAIENTHNRGGGIPWPVGQLAHVAERAHARGLRVHIDGARLWNACIAESVEPSAYAEHADTVSVCFSKGLGCPVGSALVGDSDTIGRARHLRKMLGGAMRQSGMLAAAAMYALDHHRARLFEDHARARRLTELIDGSAGLTVDHERVRTNMVYFDVDPSLGSAGDFCDRAKGDVLMLDEGPQTVRAVVHLHIDDDAIQRAGAAIRRAASRQVSS